MSNQFPESVFREYDIRGLAEKELNSFFSEILGATYGEYLWSQFPKKKKITVSVGRDCRLSGEKYAEALIKGLLSAKIDVVELGVCPTPVTYFSTFSINIEGAIMVTGSHNPAEYNGYKICIGKETIHGSQIQQLRILMEQKASSYLQEKSNDNTSTSLLKRFSIIQEYIEYLVNNTNSDIFNIGKKIVLDAGNGTASTVAPVLFKKLGAEVIPLFCELDGRFPNHHPDPTLPENLKHLVAKVLEEKADFGFAFDGDSDRLGMVDEKGQILFGDEVMVILSRSILKQNPGATIISEVKSSNRLYQDIAIHGGKPLMWKTGHSLIKAKMKETKALLAGEMSGHIFFADRYFGYDDALYAALRIYEIACFHKNPFSSLLSDLPKTVSTPEIRIDCLEDKKFQLVEEIKRRLLKEFNKTIDIDGIRVESKEGWGLVRASNTQAVIVLRFEASTIQELLKIKLTIQTIIEQAAEAIGHSPLLFQ